MVPLTQSIKLASWGVGVVKAKRHGFAERRHTLGHSQEKLAQILGVELSTVGRWERGETSPQPWCRPRLADALKVSLEELDRFTHRGPTSPGDLGRAGGSRARSGALGTVEPPRYRQGGNRAERR